MEWHPPPSACLNFKNLKKCQSNKNYNLRVVLDPTTTGRSFPNLSAFFFLLDAVPFFPLCPSTPVDITESDMIAVPVLLLLSPDMSISGTLSFSLSRRFFLFFLDSVLLAFILLLLFFSSLFSSCLGNLFSTIVIWASVLLFLWFSIGLTTIIWVSLLLFLFSGLLLRLLALL